MHRQRRRHELARVADRLNQQIVLRVQRPAAIAEAVEADLQQRLGAAPAQLWHAPALVHAEEQRALRRGEPPLVPEPQKLCLPTPSPATLPPAPLPFFPPPSSS